MCKCLSTYSVCQVSDIVTASRLYIISKFSIKSHKGTGLGLYISKNIVEAHSGKLYASNNTDGKGATFTIILPLVNKEQKQK
ncbi:MAG: ATP-binding protein [Nitrososphaeraceae archaeon]